MKRIIKGFNKCVTYNVFDSYIATNVDEIEIESMLIMPKSLTSVLLHERDLYYGININDKRCIISDFLKLGISNERYSVFL